MDPRFGDDATGFERRRFVVQMVDDEVEDLWREGGHRGLPQDTRGRDGGLRFRPRIRARSLSSMSFS